MDLQQIITALPAQLNIPLLIGLLALGYMIKHIPALDKVNNNLIPIILPVCSVIVALLMYDISTANDIVTAFISGLTNAAVSVWMHQSGKNIFEMINADTIKELIEDDKTE